jgi:hypothetical protein
MKLNSITLSLVLSLSLILGGCAANFNSAQNVYNGVNIALNLAQGELPMLVTVGAISQADETAIANYLTLAQTFNGNYESCISNAQNTTLPTASKFKDCLGIFAASLSDPAVLAEIHVVSAKGQSKAQAYIAAIVGAVNIGLSAFKAGQVATPTVAKVTAETQKDTREFQAQVVDHLPLHLRIVSGL